MIWGVEHRLAKSFWGCLVKILELTEQGGLLRVNINCNVVINNRRHIVAFNAVV